LQLSHSPTGESGSGAGRRLAAIAFVDIVGYSILMAEDETRTHQRWMRILAEIIRPAARRHRGTVVKSTGDGILAEFPSAFDAVEWAREVQRRIAAEDAGAEPELPSIRLRIAVHLGDIMETDDDIYGDGVNVAARLQEHAEPGGIVLSEAVHDLVRGSIRASVRDIGALRLKNIARPVHAYAIAPDLGRRLEPVRPAPTALPSIAVLPLKNLSGSPDDDYFAEGVIEDIIVSLAGLRELIVIARSSTLAVGRRQSDPREVGRELGVRYVLLGSVRRSADVVRLSVRLVDAQTGANLWVDTEEIQPRELFELQDRVVGRIVAGIAPQLRAAELSSALRRRPGSFTAYDHTLRALAAMHSLEKATFFQAREHLERAMAEDPDFAMAVAWAARWHSFLIGQGWSSDRQADAAKAVALAAKAIELDRHNALALATYAHLRSFLFHDYESALVYFDRALASCPNSALAWLLSSGTLSYVGRSEEAIRHAQHAIWLSPFDQSLFYFYMFLGLAYYGAGQYEEAVKWGRMSLHENPLYTANLRILTAGLSALGLREEARACAAKLVALEPQFSVAEYAATRQPFRELETKTKYIGHLREAGLPD
jgi:adenylate cyclase